MENAEPAEKEDVSDNFVLDMNQNDKQCDEEVILNAIKKAGYNDSK